MCTPCASPARTGAPSWISFGSRTARSSSTGTSRRTFPRRCRTTTGCSESRIPAHSRASGNPGQNTGSPPSRRQADRELLPHILHHPLWADFSAIDVARRIRRDALGCAGGVAFLDRVRDERRHRAVLGAADADAALPAVMILRDGLRFGVCHVDHIVLVDIDAARPAELRPLIDELAILIENLDAVVLPV